MSDKIIAMAKEAGFADWYGTDDVRFLEVISRFRDLCLEEAAKECLEISTDKWAEYKGRKPYSKAGPNCANPHTEGLSDGAEDCAYAIRALKESK